MTSRALHGSCRDSRRTQSEVIGVVLLFGLVAVASIGMIVTGGQVLTGIESDANQERIEQGFVELSATMATAAQDGDTGRTVGLEAGDYGVIAKDETGWMNVSAGDFEGNYSIGTIEYEADDGTTVAYQAGGVFRETDGATQVVSSPQINYDMSEKTLTMSITTVSDETILDSGTINIAQENATYANDDPYLDREEATITVESEYYLGWKEYFEEQAGDTVVRDVDHDNQTVTVVFGYSETDGVFGSSLTYSPDGDIDDSEGNIDYFENASQAYYPPLDDLIEQLVSDARNEEGGFENVVNLTQEGEDADLEDGTYYIDELTDESVDELTEEDGDGNISFDLSSGNATLVVEGNINTSGKVEVTGVENTDNALRIYSGGDTFQLDGDFCVDDCEQVGAKHLQVYGTSDMGINFGPESDDATFEGVIYAAADEHNEDWHDDDWQQGEGNQCSEVEEHPPQMVFQANDEEFYGGLVVYSACAHSASMDFEYDEDLEDAEIDIYPDGYGPPPETQYLNIAHYEMRVDN